MSHPQLEFVEPSADPNVNILLYGAAKTGKTVGAASAPGPILYLNADRPNATRYAHTLRDDIYEAPVKGLDTLVAAAELLTGTGNDAKSVVLDPIGEVYRVILEEMSGRALHPKIQEYGNTGTHVERFCRLLCEAPVNAIFVCHETAQKDEESGAFERLPYTGTNNPAFAAKLMAMVDVIGYTGIVEGKEGESQFLAQLVNSRGRRGGDRFGALGPSRDVNISEWIDLARKASAPKKRAKKEAAAA